MAESVDLKQMVQTFRVSELQVLLGFAGKNKSGRKTEMMSRALDLVSRRVSSSVQEKVKELYRRRYPTRASNKESTQPTPAAQSSNGSAFCPKKSWSKDYSSQQQQSLNQMTSPPSTSSRSHHHHSSSHHHQSSSSSSVGMNAYASAAAAAAPSSQATHQNYSGLHIPVNPDVTLKNLPFYDTIGVLLKPSSLVARSPSRFQEAFFVFHLTPQQTNAIMNSRDTRPNSKCEYTVQVQMRFCLLETSCDQDDVFPPSICVRVNGKVAPLPNPIPTNKPGMEPKRPGRPVNITYISRISATVSNHINVSWASEYGRVFCVSVYLVKALTSDVLYQRLKHKGVRHSDHTRALIKEKLAHDPDSEIATTSLRVSLRCPLGKMRMTTPCRAITCNHLQCFDLSMYLQMNERKPTWMCPVCDKPAGYKKLFIDGLFTEINLKNPDSDEMEFFEDGSWQPRKENDDKQRDESANVVQAIGIDDDVSFSSSPKTQNVSDGLGGGSGSAAGAEVSVIDLTETDDEVSDAETEIQAAPGAGNESVVDSASHLSSPRPPSINNISMSSSDESTPTHISHDRRGNDNGPLVWQSASTPDAAQTSQPTTNPGTSTHHNLHDPIHDAPTLELPQFSRLRRDMITPPASPSPPLPTDSMHGTTQPEGALGHSSRSPIALSDTPSPPDTRSLMHTPPHRTLSSPASPSPQRRRLERLQDCEPSAIPLDAVDMLPVPLLGIGTEENGLTNKGCLGTNTPPMPPLFPLFSMPPVTMPTAMPPIHSLPGYESDLPLDSLNNRYAPPSTLPGSPFHNLTPPALPYMGLPHLQNTTSARMPHMHNTPPPLSKIPPLPPYNRTLPAGHRSSPAACNTSPATHRSPIALCSRSLPALSPRETPPALQERVHSDSDDRPRKRRRRNSSQSSKSKSSCSQHEQSSPVPQHTSSTADHVSPWAEQSSPGPHHTSPSHRPQQSSPLAQHTPPRTETHNTSPNRHSNAPPAQHTHSSGGFFTNGDPWFSIDDDIDLAADNNKGDNTIILVEDSD